MLIEFTTGNFLSFKEKKTLNLEPASISDFPENVLVSERFRLLKCAAIYGANSSGKSNLLKAMSTMREIVLASASKSSADEWLVIPFMLSDSMGEQPSFFEIVFAIGSVQYRYGFEITRSRVMSEWLFEAQKKAERPLFVRVPEGIDVSSRFREGKNLESKTRENALFLSVVDQFNGEISRRIIQWFERLIVISGLRHEILSSQTFSILGDETEGNSLKKLFGFLDLGFPDVKLVEKDFETSDFMSTDLIFDLEVLTQRLNNRLEGKKHTVAKTVHQKFDENGNPTDTIEFDLRLQESSGTNKIFDLAGPIFSALRRGSVLAVDELDAKLHPLITLSIIRLFNSGEHNPRNAQLVFATHDTNLLSMGRFRRDQIFFTEKDEREATDLYSLVEYKENGAVRKDRSFQKDYIQGRYGAIPFIGELSKLSSSWLEK